MAEGHEAPEPVAEPNAWECAYARFETPERERAKFRARLRSLGAAGLSRESRVLEIFCGRGNGLHAWEDLGFTRVEGLDLSPALLAQYGGGARVHEGDARDLPFEAVSFDVVCVQGGLHHLASLDDLAMCLDEVARVLAPGGRFLIVEPWLTPFLKVVHAATRSRAARAAWGKLDALAVMIEHERETYEAWLGAGPAILRAIESRFVIERRRVGGGKIKLVARPGSGRGSTPGPSGGDIFE